MSKTKAESVVRSMSAVIKQRNIAILSASDDSKAKRLLTVKTVSRQHLDTVASQRLQNALIDFMSVNKCTDSEIVAELLHYDFFTVDSKASARVARHSFRDFEECVLVRSQRTHDLLATAEIKDSKRFR